jgi:hypothetical protein
LVTLLLGFVKFRRVSAGIWFVFSMMASAFDFFWFMNYELHWWKPCVANQINQSVLSFTRLTKIKSMYTEFYFRIAHYLKLITGILNFIILWSTISAYRWSSRTPYGIFEFTIARLLRYDKDNGESFHTKQFRRAINSIIEKTYRDL